MCVEAQSKRYRPWLCLAPCLCTYQRSDYYHTRTTNSNGPHVLQFHVRHCTMDIFVWMCVWMCEPRAEYLRGPKCCPCPVPVPRHHADHAELILLPASIACGAVGTCPARTPKAGWGAERKGTRLLLDEREGWTKDRLAVDTAQMGLAFLQGNTWYIPLEKVSTDRGQTASYSSRSYVVAIALVDISPKNTP